MPTLLLVHRRGGGGGGGGVGWIIGGVKGSDEGVEKGRGSVRRNEGRKVGVVERGMGGYGDVEGTRN